MIDVLIGFVKWFNENGWKLAVPMLIKARAEGSLRFGFVGLTDALEVIVYGHGLSVTVTHEGECWDVLLDLDFVPESVAGGVVCKLCIERPRKVFLTRDALFLDHIIVPFLEWAGATLRPADAIGLGGEKGRMTWATLLRPNDRRGYTTTIPLRE